MNPGYIQLTVLSLHADEFVSLEEAKTLFESGTPFHGSNDVDVIAKKEPPDDYEAIGFLCSVMKEKSSKLGSNNASYTVREELVELKKFGLKRRGFPLVFAALSKSVTKLF